MTPLIFATTVAVCSLSVDPLCGPALPNLVTNGGFETVDLSGWTLDCPEGACSVEPDSSGFGGQFRRTIVDNPYATLSQILQLKPGHYAFSYSMRDSTVLSSHSVPNELTVGLGPIQVRHNLSEADQNEYREFATNGGSIELSFEWFTLYLNSNVTQSMVLDDISVVQLDDGGAAQSANAALATARNGAQNFVGTIFNAQGWGPTRLSAWPVATAVAGPAAMRSGKTRAWASGSNSQASWDDSNAKSHGSSVSGGVEADAGDNWTTGFAATFSEMDSSLSGPVSAVESAGRSASFALYASWESVDSALSVRATAGGGFSSRDYRRANVFGFDPVAVDNIDGSHWFAAAEAGYDFRPESFLSLIPYVRLAAVEAREDGYIEPDPAGWLGAVAVTPATLDSLSTHLGLRAASTGVMDPMLSIGLFAAWRHEYLDPNSSSFTYLAPSSPAFTLRVPGLREGRNSAVFGAEFDAALWDQTSIFVRYDGEASDGFDAHSGQAGIRSVW